jgi:hypothetical protein
VFCEWWPAALELLYHNSTIAPGTELQTLHLYNARFRCRTLLLFNTRYIVEDKTPLNTRVADITPLRHQTQRCRHHMQFTSTTPDNEYVVADTTL